MEMKLIDFNAKVTGDPLLLYFHNNALYISHDSPKESATFIGKLSTQKTYKPKLNENFFDEAIFELFDEGEDLLSIEYEFYEILRGSQSTQEAFSTFKALLSVLKIEGVDGHFPVRCIKSTKRETPLLLDNPEEDDCRLANFEDVTIINDKPLYKIVMNWLKRQGVEFYNDLIDLTIKELDFVKEKPIDTFSYIQRNKKVKISIYNDLDIPEKEEYNIGTYDILTWIKVNNTIYKPNPDMKSLEETLFLNLLCLNQFKEILTSEKKSFISSLENTLYNIEKKNFN